MDTLSSNASSAQHSMIDYYHNPNTTHHSDTVDESENGKVLQWVIYGIVGATTLVVLLFWVVACRNTRRRQPNTAHYNPLQDPVPLDNQPDDLER